MTPIPKRALFAAAALALAVIPARANTIFTLDPADAQLHGGRVTADTLLLGDYGQVVESSGGTTFAEQGYLPVNGLSLAGHPVAAGLFQAPGGNGWGAAIQYSGSGTLGLSPLGLPAVIYTTLQYKLVGYNGLASFSFGANGNPVLGGPVSHLTTLATGSLIAGQLAFVPVSATALAVTGTLSTAVNGVETDFVSGNLTAIDLTIDHPPADYAFTSPSTIRFASKTGVTAALSFEDDGGRFSGGNSFALFGTTLRAAPVLSGGGPNDVAEPASIAVLGFALAGIAAFRSRQA